MKMIWQGLKALDEKSQEPLEGDTHRLTNAAQRKAFQQQAFDERPLVLRNKILFAALNELAATVVALVILFAIVNVPIFLVLG
jgi:hypothetical protein